MSDKPIEEVILDHKEGKHESSGIETCPLCEEIQRLASEE